MLWCQVQLGQLGVGEAVQLHTVHGHPVQGIIMESHRSQVRTKTDIKLNPLGSILGGQLDCIKTVLRSIQTSSSVGNYPCCNRRICSFTEEKKKIRNKMKIKYLDIFI